MHEKRKTTPSAWEIRRPFHVSEHRAWFRGTGQAILDEHKAPSDSAQLAMAPLSPHVPPESTRVEPD